jgi:hypothetical protein
MDELGHLLSGLGPVFAALFYALIVAAMLALFLISLPRLAHRG